MRRKAGCRLWWAICGATIACGSEAVPDRHIGSQHDATPDIGIAEDVASDGGANMGDADASGVPDRSADTSNPDRSSGDDARSDVAPDAHADASADDAGTVDKMPPPVGYWRFDDCAAGRGTLNDDSGNNFALTITGGLTCDGAGKPMIAGSFDGANGVASVADKAAMNAAIANAFTIAAWVKPATLPTSARDYAIATKWDDAKDAFSLRLTSSGYEFAVALPPAAGSNAERRFTALAPAAFSSTSWTHVAGTYDKATGSVVLYVNGSVAAMATASAPAAMQTSPAPLRIGNAAGAAHGFAGLVDEVWLGGTALTRAEVRALMNGPHVDSVGACLEAPKTSKVLVLVYDPYHPSMHRDQTTHGHSIVDAVAASHQLVDVFRKTTGGLVNYQIVDVRLFNGKPPRGGTPVPGSVADYGAILRQNDLCGLVRNQNLSEVWIWGDNDSGLDELAYKVPNDAIPNKALEENQWLYDWRAKDIPDCGKTVVVMGWNYFVGLDNVVHAYNHRVECMLSMTVGRGRFLQNYPDPAKPNQQTDPLLDPTNPWSTFSRWDAFAGDPHKAAVGTTHFPPNGTQDYDYGNMTPVETTAEDWLAYPFLTGAKTPIACSAWGCDALAYQQWYESHIPRASGTSYAGLCNDWWTYITDYDRRNAPCSGASCLQPVGALCDHDGECATSNCKCGACAAAGTSPPCKLAAFDPCTAPSQCASGICGCPGETGATACLPDANYASTCKQPNGGPCWGDLDCASGVCGCNGGAVVQCLPAGSNRACANVGNWSACLNDGECTSGVCGCFAGHHPLVCLPSTAYPKTCN
jgi:hypothetical protein